MKRFFVLFEIPAGTVDEWRKTTASDQAEAASAEMMAAWSKWMADHRAKLRDTGGPLGKTKRVTSSGIEDVRNDLNYYVIVEADSHEAAARLFATHPHLRIPTSRIEIMEMPEMPPM
jgi:hypothetical protein